MPDEDVDDYIRWHPEKACETHRPYAWWILVKDFAEDRMKLVSLLHLRTEHTSQAWAMFDTLESHYVFKSRQDATYSPVCVEMFGDNYGRLVDYNESLLHTWAIMSFTRAWITMEAQHGISHMLRKLVDAIVADASPSGNTKWARLTNNLSPTSGNTQWSFHGHPALVAPWGFDTQPLLDRAKTKRNEVADDLMLMQTDPEYLLNLVLALKASMRFADHVPTKLRWTFIAHSVLRCRINNFCRWTGILMSYERVHEVFEQDRRAIRPGTDLPVRAGIAMWSLRFVLDEAAQTQCDELQERVFEMAALKDLFELVYENRDLSWRPLKPLDTSKQSHRIYASTFGVKAAMRDNYVCGARLWVEAFIDAIKPFNYEKAVDDSISSVALIDELRLARVWSQLGPFRAPPKEKLAEANLSRNDSEPDVVHGASKVTKASVNDSSIENLGLLLWKFSEAPWPKDHRSPTWLNKVTESRKRLAAIWQAIRDGMVQKSSTWQAGMHFLSHDTSPEYAKEVQEERERFEAYIKRMKNSQASPHSVSQTLQTTWGEPNCEDITTRTQR